MKAIKIFFVVIFIFGILSLIHAASTLNTISVTYDAVSSCSDKGGWKVNITAETYLQEIHKSASVTATKAYLLNSSKGILASASFVGNNATFDGTDLLSDETLYYFAVDSESASYNEHHKIENNYPYSSTDFNVIIGLDCGSGGVDSNARVWSISSVVTGDSSLPTTVTLNSPTNQEIFASSSINFTATYNISISEFNWTNATHSVWYSNGTLVNSTILDLSGQHNQTILQINNLILGDYYWNSQGCYSNDTFSECVDAANNNTFSIGASTTQMIYNAHSYETASETFRVGFDIIEGAEVSLASLVYNGTSYPVSDISQSGSVLNLTKRIDLPLNSHPFANETKSFYFVFTYNGGFVQNTSTYQQNTSFINLQICNATYETKALNFTFTDETTQTIINSSDNPIDFQGFFNFWKGEGTIMKNYSYITLGNNTVSNIEFCMIPINESLHTNMISLYDAVDYAEREYSLDNASISNASSNINLFLLNDTAAVKFTITVKQGVSFLTDAYITVSKLFIGDGQYKTISIRESDDSGEFVEYLELDRDYRYSVVKNGVLIGVVNKRSSCAAAPCELTLQIEEGFGNIWEAYNDLYAQNVYSNLTYNHSNKVVTYNFIDITGLAQYFRLEVSQLYLNDSTSVLCNDFAYSSSGTLTCDLSNYDGDFIAKTYISRSPEKLDKILTIIISEIKESLGLLAVFIAFIIILSVTAAGVVVSNGNPSVTLFMFGISILATKLMTFFPFSWGVVALIELGTIVMATFTKT